MSEDHEQTRIEKIEQKMLDSPLFNLGTIATVITILSVLGGFLTWYVGYFQTTADATALEIRNARRDAWASYGIADIRMTLARNRVFECISKEQRKDKEPMVSSEIIACEQYRIDFNTAKTRADQLFVEAMAFGKDK